MFNGFTAQDLDLPTGRIHYRMGGAGDAVLLLHGFPQTHAMWGYIAPLLAQGYRVICPDLRGYGASHKPLDVADYSFREMARDPIALMDHLGIDRFHVVGHDRGGRTAHRMALDIPDRIKSITVMDIVPTHLLLADLTADVARAYYHWFFLIQPAPLPETLIGHDPKFFLERKMRHWGKNRDAITDDAFDDYLRCFSDPQTIHASCEDYRASNGIDLEHDAADANRKLTMPLLALWGANGMVGNKYDMLAAWCDVAENVSGFAVPCGHYLPEEAPDETYCALLNFFTA